MLILEEAHHLLLQEKGRPETITDIFLMEIRETDQVVCLLDQSPSLISTTALSNVNTLIAMQLRHQDDICRMAKALLLKEEEYFGMLRTREAIVKTQHPRPFLVRFPLTPSGKAQSQKMPSESTWRPITAVFRKVRHRNIPLQPIRWDLCGFANRINKMN